MSIWDDVRRHPDLYRAWGASQRAMGNLREYRDISHSQPRLDQLVSLLAARFQVGKPADPLKTVIDSVELDLVTVGEPMHVGEDGEAAHAAEALVRLLKRVELHLLISRVEYVFGAAVRELPVGIRRCSLSFTRGLSCTLLGHSFILVPPTEPIIEFAGRLRASVEFRREVGACSPESACAAIQTDLNFLFDSVDRRLKREFGLAIQKRESSAEYRGRQKEESQKAATQKAKPKGNRGGEKRPKANAAIHDLWQTRPESQEWSIRQLSEATGYAISTISGCPAWKTLQGLRQQQKDGLADRLTVRDNRGKRQQRQ